MTTPITQGPVDVNVRRLQEENRILRYLLAMAHDGEDEKHVYPLQLDVIDAQQWGILAACPAAISAA